MSQPPNRSLKKEVKSKPSAKRWLIACDILAMLLLLTMLLRLVLGQATGNAGQWLAFPVILLLVCRFIISQKASKAGESSETPSPLEVEHLRTRVAEQQQTIEEISDRTRLLLENIGVGILITDSLGTIRFIGLQAARLTGYSRSELADRSLESLFKNGTPTFSDLVTRNFPARLICQGKNGEEIWVDLWLAQVMLEKKLCYVVSMCDASEAVKAVQRRQELIAQITHELRSPLTAIYASLSILTRKDKMKPEDEANILTVCSRNAQSMKLTIDEILDYSKLEAGKLVVELNPVNLQEIVYQATESVRSLAESKTLSLKVEIEPLVVLADSRRIIQVLTNLLSNAIKHSPRNKSLTVAAWAKGDRVEVSVADQGAGVSDDDKKKLFSSFAQGDDAKAIPESSSGLGLAFCKEIVNLHKGEIWIDDAPGGGAMFVFSLRKA
ncbi:MAG: PAS domain-containing sensor histidine kinase [Candidatus Obscuribacterales bacterium]|nr:PAS domain-containing sensor histidine kinase [Candidatus Obscuribacterales bacterium]